MKLANLRVVLATMASCDAQNMARLAKLRAELAVLKEEERREEVESEKVKRAVEEEDRLAEKALRRARRLSELRRREAGVRSAAHAESIRRADELVRGWSELRRNVECVARTWGCG